MEGLREQVEAKVDGREEWKVEGADFGGDGRGRETG